MEAALKFADPSQQFVTISLQYYFVGETLQAHAVPSKVLVCFLRLAALLAGPLCNHRQCASTSSSSSLCCVSSDRSLRTSITLLDVLINQRLGRKSLFRSFRFVLTTFLPHRRILGGIGKMLEIKVCFVSVSSSLLMCSKSRTRSSISTPRLQTWTTTNLLSFAL